MTPTTVLGKALARAEEKVAIRVVFNYAPEHVEFTHHCTRAEAMRFGRHLEDVGVPEVFEYEIIG